MRRSSRAPPSSSTGAISRSERETSLLGTFAKSTRSIVDYDLVLHDVQLVSAQGVRRATVAVADGKVADVLDAGARP